MKIKLILKENVTQPSGLKENPYNIEVVRKLKSILKRFGEQPMTNTLSGWLYPDGTCSDITGILMEDDRMVHGDVMVLLFPNYADSLSGHDRETKILYEAPREFGSLTGSIRVAYSKYFQIFTKITPQQLAWIRKHCAGEHIILSLGVIGDGQDLELEVSTIYEWNKKLNQFIINNKLASFDVLSEQRKKRNNRGFK